MGKKNLIYITGDFYKIKNGSNPKLHIDSIGLLP